MMFHKLCLIAAMAMLQTSCIVAGGYSSNGGWFIWPGSFAFILVAAVLYMLFRR